MKQILKKVLIGLSVIFALLVIFAGYMMFRLKSETSVMNAVGNKEIAEGVLAINDEFVNMFLIENKGKYIAIDAGNDLDNIKEGFSEIGIDPMDVIAVFLTHTDNDHVGAIELFKNATIYISEEEKQMIDGTTSRMGFIKNKLNHSYSVLKDKQIINSNGIVVKGVLTKGHTPGSMCYQVNKKYLFVGDVMSLEAGKAGPFNDFFNMDSEKALETQKIIANIDSVQYLITSHYGYTDNYYQAFD